MSRYITVQYYYGGEKRNEPKPIVLCVDHISALVEEDGAVLVLLTNALTYKVVGDLKSMKAMLQP